MDKKEKEIKITVYEAFDGTEFNTEIECQNYECSTVGVLLERIKNSIIKKVDNLGFYPEGSVYTYFNQYYIIEPKTRTDVFVLNQIMDLVPGREEQVYGNDCYNLICLCLNLQCNTVVDAHLIKFNEVIKNLSDNRFEVISYIKNEERKVEK